RIIPLLIWASCAFPSAAPADDVDTSKPVKVFILAGQSNMQGHGRISMGKEGDLDHAATQNAFSYLKDGDDWAERDDVWYYHKDGKGEITRAKLKPGLGARPDSVGPELAIGHVLGDHFDEPVLLIKCAWGGQAIGMTFRPPSAGMPDYLDEKFQKAQKKQAELSLDEFKERFGSRYRQTLAEVEEVVSNLEKEFPDLGGQGFELAGFFWHQGWNDGCDRQFTQEYESNMTHFIEDMRKDLGNESLPFVIATSGMGGPDATGVAGGLGKNIEPAQVRAAKKFEACTAVETRHFQVHKPGRQKSHWHNSAESYCLVGDAAAKAMVELLDK
ncbi:MAG: sialate O-acetylesterase, partial [Verrucomicrobiales bacterium]